MERVVFIAVGATLTLLLAENSLAQGEVKPGPQPQAPPRVVPARPFGNGNAQFGVRQRWRELTPEQRQRVQMNAQRWMQLPPEERRELRFRRELRRQRLQAEADAALRNSGLQLEAEKRSAYEKRYFEERVRIDRELRRELQERRQSELAPVVERLKKEFTSDPTPARSAAGGPSGSPKK